MALLHKFYIISATLLHFIKPLIIHAPAAPVCLTSFMFSLEIPPIAYTGIDTFSQIFCKNVRPLPGSHFLQSVRKICPAVM